MLLTFFLDFSSIFLRGLIDKSHTIVFTSNDFDKKVHIIEDSGEKHQYLVPYETIQAYSGRSSHGAGGDEIKGGDDHEGAGHEDGGNDDCDKS